MLQRARRLIIWMVAFALVGVIGAGSAWGRPSGIVRPPLTGSRASAAVRGASVQSTGAQGAATLRPGNPSPDCSPPASGGLPCVPPLLYGGGPVMHAVTTHVIAWGQSSAFPSYYVSGYEGYLADLAHDVGLGSNVTSVASQYVDATGPALSSLSNATPITDTDPYPSSGCYVAGASACLTEDQIKTELQAVIANDALATNWDQSYVVLLPPNVDTCTDSSATQCEGTSFCGYHDVLTIGAAATTFSLLPYTESSFGSCYDPAAAYPNGTPNDLGTLDSIGTHELIESATDPTTGGPGYAAGYLDVNGWEIGDECAYDYGTEYAATGGGYYNQLDNGNQYLIQQMWSNQDNNCVQGDASTESATIISGSNPTTTAPIAFSATLTGASSSGATYAWSYLDPSGQVHSDVSSASAPDLQLPGGTDTVWVQVTDAAGGTITGVKSVYVVGTPPTAAFDHFSNGAVITPQSNVSFVSASSADSTERITSASWSFGDGTTGSGSVATHAYASAGTYTVTLTVTETDGQTARTSQIVTVDNPPSSAFSWSPNPTAGQAVAFSSSGAAAGAGSISAYSWSFGEGGTSAAQNPTYTYSAAGNYTVTLTVTQTDGLSASVQHTVSVGAAVTQAAAAPSPAALRRGLVPRGSATRIRNLLKRGRVISVVSANAAGRITITWYAMVKHRRIVVARGSAKARAGFSARVVVRLTGAGRALLRRWRRLRVRVTGVYLAGGRRVTVNRMITLRR